MNEVRKTIDDVYHSNKVYHSINKHFVGNRGVVNGLVRYAVYSIIYSKVRSVDVILLGNTIEKETE